MNKVELHLGDCLEILPTLSNVDTIIIDPPFGTETAEWDKEPRKEVWEELQRICPDGPIAIIGYTKQLLRWSAYFELELIGKIVWHKYNELSVSPGLTRAHQDIFIWGKSMKQIHADRVREPYSKNRQLAKWHKGHPELNNKKNIRLAASMVKRGEVGRNIKGKRCTDVWSIPAPGAGFNAHLRLHPNQKPDKLIKRLILLLSDEGQTILDCYMGSGTTGECAVSLSRSFIGCELMQEYFDIAQKRITEAQAQLPLPLPTEEREQVQQVQQKLWDLTNQEK
jgi:site-specific DNA-methyltransferase (adenine-specific)